MLEVCKEMQKVRDYLDSKGVEWRDASYEDEILWICRTDFELKGNKLSILNGYGTYGGIQIFGTNQGLLELRFNQEIEGFLTAQCIINKYLEA